MRLRSIWLVSLLRKLYRQSDLVPTHLRSVVRWRRGTGMSYEKRQKKLQLMTFEEFVLRWLDTCDDVWNERFQDPGRESSRKRLEEWRKLIASRMQHKDRQQLPLSMNSVRFLQGR